MAAVRTLFVDARSVRRGATGVGTWTAGILGALDALIADGASLRVVALRLAQAEHGSWEQYRAIETQTTPIDYESHPAGDWYLQRRLLREAEATGAEALLSPAFLAPVLAARGAARVRRVVVMHDLFAFDSSIPMRSVFREYLRIMTSAALSRCEVVATSSAILVPQLQQRSRMQPVLALPGVDQSQFLPQARTRHLPDGSVRERPVVLYTASFEPRKNHALLVDALADLPVDLVLLNAEPWRGAMLPATVRVIAPHDARDVAQWTTAADVAVFPSLNEGFGMPMLEALSCGTPLLASDIAAARWLTDDGRAAKLLSPTDPHAWRGAVEQVIAGTDHDVAERVAAGVARAREFTWRRSAEALLDGALPGWR
jgi:glycosyltransferase involved in cell wall biosynthesis